MFILKFSLYSIIFLTTSSLGFIYGGRYSKRVNTLMNLHDSIRILQSEISIFSNPLSIALLNTVEKSKDEIKYLFNIIRTSLMNNYTGDIYLSFLESECYLKELLLKKEDIDLFLSLGKIIGKTNRDHQDKQFDFLLNELENLIINAKEERKINERMYRQLGLLLGLGIIIILI